MNESQHPKNVFNQYIGHFINAAHTIGESLEKSIAGSLTEPSEIPVVFFDQDGSIRSAEPSLLNSVLTTAFNGCSNIHISINFLEGLPINGFIISEKVNVGDEDELPTDFLICISADISPELQAFTIAKELCHTFQHETNSQTRSIDDLKKVAEYIEKTEWEEEIANTFELESLEKFYSNTGPLAHRVETICHLVALEIMFPATWDEAIRKKYDANNHQDIEKLASEIGLPLIHTALKLKLNSKINLIRLENNATKM